MAGADAEVVGQGAFERAKVAALRDEDDSLNGVG
jgi:hypothetical protein